MKTRIPGKERPRARPGLRAVMVLLAAAALALTACRSSIDPDRPREELAAGGVPFTMIKLPAARFPGGELGTVLLTEKRPRVIGVKADYWLAETNTTYRLWKTVYDWAVTRGYEFARPGQMGSEADGEGMDDRHPVTVVDWPSAAVWCNALTEMLNGENASALVPVYAHEGQTLKRAIPRLEPDTIIARPGADGFRLPTGLEWELAARYASERRGEDYVEYPLGSGNFWAPFIQVSGEIESKRGPIGSEGWNVLSRPVLELERNDLGFTGFAGQDGKLWQWCFEYLYNDGHDTFNLKRGGSRGPRCGRHDNWPKTKWGPTCTGYDQITFRVARNAGS